MDTLRGFDPFGSDEASDVPNYASFDEADEAAIEAPPVIGTDERRMQVRAYNFWTAQLDGKYYPSIEELDPDRVEDFRDYSVLLDFTSGIENPSIQYLGEALRIECGLSEDIGYLDQVPARSLLSRITDHYLQIIANRAPIGFEAEFVNERGLTIMYRGILLPYSSDDDTIDFIYGVINWKEVASAEMTETLELQVEDALRTAPPRQEHVPVWADGPTGGHLLGEDDAELELGAIFAAENPSAIETTPRALDQSIAQAIQAPQPDESSSLSDWLDAARICAESARASDLRSRDALYQAIGRAYDFALVADKNPHDYNDLLTDAGLTVQERAPMTPIVKLVFGASYDKTRITEFATALQYAQRNAVPMGGLGELLGNYDGGLKGIVQAERRARKVAAGQHVLPASGDPRVRLRAARVRDLSEFAGEGEEFVLLVARREADGSVAIVGSVEDSAITDKALRKTSV